jgi:glycosyltransferase involved in cell wall biosynthesis
MRRDLARHRHSAAHKGLTVLMNAGPWLPVPPHGYGGIENVVATLVPELRRRGVRVVLCTVQESTLDADRRINTFADGQFASLAGPYNKVSGIGHAHMQEVCKALRADPSIDLVHDHMEVVGLSALALLDDDAPPALHTLHWDLRKHADFYANFDGHGRVFVNGVSEQQLLRAPLALQAQAVGAVPLATSVPDEMPHGQRGDEFVMLGRVTQDKGQDIAARACSKQGRALRMAGPVGPVSGPDELPAALEDDGLRQMADVAYYLDSVRPLEDGSSIQWIGAVGGAEKRSLLINAKALLFPIQWEEPGGTAVIEALAVGTPVIGMRRGVLPDLVDHGVTGFLADTEEEFAAYLDRIDEIDRAACHRVALERFSPAAMADRYLELYHEVLTRADRHGVRPVQEISNTA